MILVIVYYRGTRDALREFYCSSYKEYKEYEGMVSFFDCYMLPGYEFKGNTFTRSYNVFKQDYDILVVSSQFMKKL